MLKEAMLHALLINNGVLKQILALVIYSWYANYFVGTLYLG